MLHEDRFVMSRKQYAADLSTLHIEPRTGYKGREYYHGVIQAVWFRRRRRGGFGPNGAVVTVACIGTLRDSQDTRPADGREFLQRHDDGRYGGDCQGRWDGSGYWGSESPEAMAEHLALLKPMLAAYERNPKAPTLPDGFDGWWRFDD
ncbi:hypothetical protein [Actinomadura geliboluensis]|uniref:hypothetical protein n=1 Tax=Actinomadura geliboluensis TaxID=882440 RepID=UPI0036877091